MFVLNCAYFRFCLFMVIRAYLFLIERTCACLCLPVLACACVCLRVLACACVCLRVHAFCVACAGMATVREGRNCSLWWLPRAVSSAWYAFAARPLLPVTVLLFSVASKCCWLLPKVGWAGRAGRAGRVACCQLFVPTAAAAAAACLSLPILPATSWRWLMKGVFVVCLFVLFVICLMCFLCP